jgi:hypothetical protein
MSGRRMGVVIIGACATLALLGCADGNQLAKHKSAPATQSVTTVDPKLADPQYWLTEPGTSWVEYPVYDALFKASQAVASDYQFVVDRRDYRDGIITTTPVVSAQFFEPWRRDVQTLGDSAHASTATHRRTVHFEITRQRDGSYEMTPKVIVERESISERRISNATYFREISGPHGAYGTRETDIGTLLPYSYWYAVGRDHTLERVLAAAVYNKLHAS